MQPFTIREAAAAVGGAYCGPNENTPITGVTIDSRKVQPGDLFVAIRGERFDGHAFIPAALAAGAVCALSETEAEGSYIRVADTLAAYQALATFYRSRMPAKVIGITGSVGKTTTKELIASALSTSLSVLFTEGNFNNQTGVPLTVFRMEESHQAAVIEMGTNHFGEIDALARIARPDIALITNIGTAHIEHFGSREGILKGKTELLAHMAPHGRAILSGDDDLLGPYAAHRQDATTFGIGPENDVRAEEIEDLGLEGSRFLARFPGGSVPVAIHSPGVHMIQNALAALAVGLTLGLDPEAVAAGIAAYVPLSGRMRIEKINGLTILNDAYNASPTAMAASLSVLGKAEGRKAAILGDMLELGPEAPRYHAEAGACAARSGVALLLAVGPLSAAMAEGYRAAGGKEAHHFSALDDLLPRLNEFLRAGDTVLVKASHSMGLSRVAETIRMQNAECIQNEE